VFPADLELAPSGADVLARLTAPFNDSGQAGFPDWSRWSGNPPGPAGVKWGGQGVCVGADSLRMRRRSAVSISRHPNPQVNTGWIHIVQVQ